MLRTKYSQHVCKWSVHLKYWMNSKFKITNFKMAKWTCKFIVIDIAIAIASRNWYCCCYYYKLLSISKLVWVLEKNHFLLFFFVLLLPIDCIWIDWHGQWKSLTIVIKKLLKWGLYQACKFWRQYTNCELIRYSSTDGSKLTFR